MRRLLLGLLISAGLASTALSQLTATLTIKNFAQAGGNYSFDVWARRTNVTGNIFVGISSFYFTYNAAGLGAPSLSNINSRFTGDGSPSSDYGPMSVAINAGKIAVTVAFTGNNTGAGASLVTTAPDGELMCTVTLPITNPAQTALVAWDEVNSAISTSNSQPVGHTYVGQDNSQLPVQLVSFAASIVQQTGYIELKWSTASETNNYGFEVQKSATNDGAAYETIPGSFVAGHGTTIEPHTYSFTDASTMQGTPYYRLKQIDLDGTVHYSDGVRPSGVTEVAEAAPKVFQLMQNYPNPFNPSTQVKFSVETTGKATVKVYNMVGEQVAMLFDGTAEAGRYYVATFDASRLATGIYFYRITTEKKNDVKKMLLVK